MVAMQCIEIPLPIIEFYVYIVFMIEKYYDPDSDKFT